MTVIETIMRDIQSLSLRQQVEVARYVQRLSETARRKRVAVLSQTYGSLDETDGRAFEEALAIINAPVVIIPIAGIAVAAIVIARLGSTEYSSIPASWSPICVDHA